jgi:hypothetical protein
LAARVVVTSAAKFSSSASAAANSFSVLSISGAPSTKPFIFSWTNAVVAIWVVFVVPVAVGAVGTPVSAGEAKGALSARLFAVVVKNYAIQHFAIIWEWPTFFLIYFGL